MHFSLLKSNTVCFTVYFISLGSIIFWSFDNTLQDLYNIYNTVGTNGPTFSSPGYNGAGSCLQLSSSSAQSVSVASPFLNLTYKSFSLEVWAYPTTMNNPSSDNAIFGQYEQSSTSRGLHINIRSQRIYFGFFGDDVSGTTVSKKEKARLVLVCEIHQY